MKITLESSAPIEVPKILKEEAVEAFVSEGFHISPNLLSDEEIQEMLDDAPKLIRGDYSEPLNPLDLTGHETDQELLEMVLCMHQPHFFSPTIEKYVRHPKICGILSQLTGAHLPHWDGSVKCMQSMYFVKPPGFQGQAWHQDEIYIPTRDRSLIGAWIALDDATIDNGCLWVLPRSHRHGMLFPHKPHDKSEEYDSSPESYGFEDSEQIPVEVPKGSVVFFNGYLLHRSQKNRADRYRRVLVNHYMSTSSHLPWTQESTETIAKKDDRVVMTVAGSDPYAWKGETRVKQFHFRAREATKV